VKILLFTSAFPYGGDSENFLRNELNFGSEISSITVLPFSKRGSAREVPNNVLVNNVCNTQSKTFYLIVLIKMLFSFYFWKSILSKKFIKAKKINQKYFYIKSLFGALIIKAVVKKRKIHYDSDTIFYSYWLTYAPLGLAMLKREGFLKNKIVSRGHSYDIDEEEVGFHFPLRNLIYKYIDHIFPISTIAAKTIIRRYPKSINKLNVERLGVLSIKNSLNILEPGVIKVISCSGVRKEKRVNLILKSLNRYCREHPNSIVQWTHIGGGGIDFKNLEKEIKSAEQNLKINLLGNLDYNEIYNYYKKNDLNIFINLSLREGVPVAIMEALSASMTVLATDVGATSEIVNKDTGVLINKNFSQKDFNNGINHIIDNYQNLSKKTYKIYKKYYNANSNYINFYEKLNEINKT
jgi:colanic acid/amylovoran biosynthesis glycosyltransferase